MTIKQLAKKLYNVGYITKPIILQKNDKTVEGLKIEHDYDGLYPDKQTFNICNELVKIANKYKFNIEHRGHYTATFIW